MREYLPIRYLADICVIGKLFSEELGADLYRLGSACQAHIDGNFQQRSIHSKSLVLH